MAGNLQNYVRNITGVAQVHQPRRVDVDQIVTERIGGQRTESHLERLVALLLGRSSKTNARFDVEVVDLDPQVVELDEPPNGDRLEPKDGLRELVVGLRERRLSYGLIVSDV